MYFLGFRGVTTSSYIVYGYITRDIWTFRVLTYTMYSIYTFLYGI